MPLPVGTRVGSYEILSLIGAGGMGEVYRARDIRLKRDVAIKILPDAFASDAERLARFKREAQVLASFNHPHIAAIYGLEETPSGNALVLELVDGPTLADRISQGPILLDEALPIAKQIAEAMEAAHERGIIHRDLKPANIKLTADGSVKVLDFGLAKAVAEVGHASASLSPTITSPAMTMRGVLLGSAAYMSPEQAKGREADKRSDVWGFGCVLYEMLTGKRAFDGEDLTETIAAVVKSEPDWGALRSNVPVSIRTLLRRCLEKDRRRRVGDIAVALFVLDDPLAGSQFDPTTSTPLPLAKHNTRWRVVVVGIVALLVGGLLAVAGLRAITPPIASRLARFIIAPTGPAAVTALTLDRELAIAPDSSRIVYVGNNGTQFFVRPLDRVDAEPLPGVSGAPRGPFISPDSQWIGFFDGDKLKKVAISGGPALVLASFGGQRAGAAWTPDDSIVFATTDTTSGLWRVSAAGGQASAITKPNPESGEADHLWPEILPSGQAALFTITHTSGLIEAAQVAVLDLKSGAKKILVRGGSHAHYVPTGHLVYGVEGTLRAVAFDLDRLEVIGAPIPVLTHVVTTNAGAANFDVSRDGTLVYIPLVTMSPPGAERTLTWVDRQGREQPIKAPKRAYTYLTLSPDETRVALDIRDQQADVWIWSFAGETLTRLTTSPSIDASPVWMPDGRRIAFGSNQGLFLQAADGTGAPERLGVSSALTLPTTTSPDGTQVLFHGAPGNGEVMVMAMDKGRTAQPLLVTQFVERNAEISPDGRWVAYESWDSGRAHVYVRPFPDANAGRWQVSSDGGTQPVWSDDGRELFYVAFTGALMSIRVDGGSTWKSGVPAKVLEGGHFHGMGPALSQTYDVSKDGRRFLMIKPDPTEPNNPLATSTGGPVRRSEQGIVVVQNWDQELKRLVPTR